MPRVAVLISGRGSNLQSLIDAVHQGQLAVSLACVISNDPQAAGLARARRAGVPAEIVDHRAYASREDFAAALAARVDGYDTDLVILAGFMRILTAGFVERYHGRLVNIHPSLLPRLPGLQTHERALEAGLAEHGASVHFVTGELDGGPIIAQARVRIGTGDGPESLAARVLEREHVLLPRVVGWLASGRVQLVDGAVVFDGGPLRAPLTV